MMPAPLSPLAPCPNIPPTVPRFSSPSSAPHTPNRSPVTPNILLSPPPANRNSTDSWNSSNYGFEDANAEWKDEEVRLLSRTLDALPAHLITPFNGSVPPSNLLDKISRGISAAKGPNCWPHSIRATRIKLLDLARLKAQEERRTAIIEEDSTAFGEVTCKGDTQRHTTPDPPEVFQLRTNTPIHTRRPLYRQSSMDFMDPDQSDRSESIARLSTRLQRHDHVLHHPYLRPTHARHRSEYNRPSPSSPSSSTLNSNQYSGVRKSTVSATSASSSSFGSPMSTSAPLRPSSLRCASTLTLASAREMQVDAEAEVDNPLNELRSSGGYEEASMGTNVAVKSERLPSCNDSNASLPVLATPPSKQKKPKSMPATGFMSQRRPTLNSSAGEMKTMSRTSLNEPRVLISEKVSPDQNRAHAKKARQGHKPQLSHSSDEDEKVRSKSAKKARTREPSWSAAPASTAQAQPSLLLSSALPRDEEVSDSARSTITGGRSKTSASSNSSMDNDLSTASAETAATTVSISSTSASQAKYKSPRSPTLRIQARHLTQSSAETKKPARRNPAHNLCMFGLELPCPQRTPASPSRIPVSSPMPLSPPVNSGCNLAGTPFGSPVPSRPRTLRRAARRISFGSLAANGSLLSPAESPRRHDADTLALGSAFQLV